MQVATTTINLPCISRHAELRMAQRNISESDLRFVLVYGKEYHKAGAIHFVLRRTDIPSERLCNSELARLEGTTVLISRDYQELITVYRPGRDGPRQVRSKRPYSRHARAA